MSHFIRVRTGYEVASADALLALQIVYAELVPTQFRIYLGPGMAEINRKGARLIF